MRLVSFVAAAAVAVCLPSAASAVVMVAHFEGTIGAPNGTGSDRFGVPLLTTFSGPFVAEFIFDTQGGTAISNGRSFGAIQSAWLQWSHGGAPIRLDLPTVNGGRGVTARANGFSIQAVNNKDGGRSFDTLTLNANFTHDGRLDTVVAPLTVNNTGSANASSIVNDRLVVDLFGGNAEGAGMPLMITRFSLAEYVAPSTGGVPEPATWALLIGGFGGAGAMLRRRRALEA